jgi:hypothetical protein
MSLVPGSSERSRAKRHRDEESLRRALAATPVSIVPDDAKAYVRERVLDYAGFCEDQAWSSRLWYYGLRIPAIVIATIVPALIAANLGSTGRVIATGLGVIVAALGAVEHFLNVGERWRHYRSLVERLKSETWAYLSNALPYNRATGAEAARRDFVDRIEHIIQEDVTRYLAITHTEGTQTGTPQRASGQTDPGAAGAGAHADGEAQAAAANGADGSPVTARSAANGADGGAGAAGSPAGHRGSHARSAKG